MGKKNLVVRNPLGQRQALTPEPIRPQQAIQDDTKEVNQQRNMETSTSSSSVLSSNEQKQQSITKRYATYFFGQTQSNSSNIMRLSKIYLIMRSYKQPSMSILSNENRTK